MSLVELFVCLFFHLVLEQKLERITDKAMRIKNHSLIPETIKLVVHYSPYALGSASSSGASFFAWWRRERNASDW